MACRRRSITEIAWTLELILGTLATMHRRPLPHAGLDSNPPVSLHPEAGRGFSGHPAVIAHRPASNRTGWDGQFVFVSHAALENGVVFSLVDADRGLGVELECILDPLTDVLSTRSRLTNTANTPISVDWLAAPVIAPAQHFSEQMSFFGRWCAEFGFERKPISPGLTSHENRRGRTSHEAFPGTILLTPATGEEHGDCLAMHLGWSGNHRLLIERLTTGDIQVQMGVLLFSGEGHLEPGESMVSPWLYCAHSAMGLNDLSQKLHAHIRQNILKFPVSGKPRPVTVNTWEAIYFNHDHDRLTALADAAANIGAERFVLDDGWFNGRNDDTTSLGDWYADGKKYPRGLQPIAEYVRKKGMEFGLWVEPEMVNPKSELYQAHPDWVLSLGNYPRITGRNQLVLDISNSAVGDYLYGCLFKLVDDHDIAYLKWDMNRDHVLPGDAAGRAAAYRQTGALYALMDRLLTQFPKLEIESCASGGGRIDYEILKRTHRFWTSDSNDAVERMRIQTGFSYFFPPEVMGAHVGPAWSHTSGRGLHAGFRALVASYGHMGIEADLTQMSDDERQTMADAIARHKADRSIWHTGKFHRISTVDPNLFGVLSVSPDQDTARMVITQVDRARSTISPRIRIPGLDRNKTYKITCQMMSEQVKKASRQLNNPLFDRGFAAEGHLLQTVGISLPSLYAQTGIAIALDAINKQERP